MGGVSAEREVSLKSGAAVLAALKNRGVNAHGVDVDSDPLLALRDGDFDRVFNILHGGIGENGTLQGVLEVMSLPYSGSGVLASAIGMDKWRNKLLWQAAGLPVPECVLLDAKSDFSLFEQMFDMPLFVKPANEGSSVGISMVKQAGELAEAYHEAAKYDSMVLAEKYLGGGEYTVAILNGEALPPVKIETSNDYYDYSAKYLQDDTRYLCPCGLNDEQVTRMQALALQAFMVLGARGWGRIDVLLDESGEPFLLEANTVPGMTDHSLVPMAARAAGIEFDELVWRILETTLESQDG
ncbi:MAG: D-alanine--D-alanine ligase [Pseudomonadota bacterium]